MARPPHQRLAAGRRDGVEENLARLYIRDDRGARMIEKHRTRQQHQQLIRPENFAFPIDNADPVAIAVQRNAEVRPLAKHFFLQLDEILRLGRVGVMGRKARIHHTVDQDVLAGKSCRQ